MAIPLLLASVTGRTGEMGDGVRGEMKYAGPPQDAVYWDYVVCVQGETGRIRQGRSKSNNKVVWNFPDSTVADESLSGCLPGPQKGETGRLRAHRERERGKRRER